jgi:hypothetical protein
MKILITFFTILLISLQVSAQIAPDKYWIRFTDKNNSPFSIENPEAFLSQKAIDRRNVQGIPIAENDLPVNPSYLSAVANTGATLLNISKWFNSVTVFTTDPSVIDDINALPFVLSVAKMTNNNSTLNTSIKPFFENETYSKFQDSIKMKGSGESFDYGQGYNQINMLNGILLHDLGYNGEGMTIAVLDAGFRNADILTAFDSLWMNNRILGYKDFVDPLNPDIFASHSHGTNVLSTMGANLPGELVGTAPRASYWLLRSEDGGSEYLIEELNWASAAEFADSAGVDIINSSLGYTTFDDPSQNHTYMDMDGNTTPITIAADLAASKGMIVVNSAGNEGSGSWQYIGAPADGDSVFSIGAVDASGNYAYFSSTGPTYDGRLKPNVVAQGQGSAIVSAWSGIVLTGSGTSFSSPITAGIVACLWQAHPDKTNMEILEAIQQNGSQAGNPDNLLGYGIPDYFAAHNQLSTPVIHEITLDVKLYLEGPFNGSNMNSNLNPLLPLAQPYNTPPFDYPGDEQVASIPSTDIIDWILVELRDASSPSQAFESTSVESKAAFLKNDGTLIDIGGINPITFNIAYSDSLYLVIRHRNHLGVMSANALKNNGENIYSYDYRTGTDKVHGGSAGYKEISSGVYGMVAGDANADGIINLQDKTAEWENEAGNMDYLPGDFNCDGQVDNIDKDDFWQINTSYSSQVPE